MDRTEHFAELWEQFEERFGAELEAWEVSPMKLHYANTYQRIVGVYPDERHRLRAELERALGRDRSGSRRPTQANGGSGGLSASDVFA